MGLPNLKIYSIVNHVFLLDLTSCFIPHGIQVATCKVPSRITDIKNIAMF